MRSPSTSCKAVPRQARAASLTVSPFCRSLSDSVRYWVLGSRVARSLPRHPFTVTVSYVQRTFHIQVHRSEWVKTFYVCTSSPPPVLSRYPRLLTLDRRVLRPKLAVFFPSCTYKYIGGPQTQAHRKEKLVVVRVFFPANLIVIKMGRCTTFDRDETSHAPSPPRGVSVLPRQNIDKQNR